MPLESGALLRVWYYRSDLAYFINADNSVYIDNELEITGVLIQHFFSGNTKNYFERVLMQGIDSRLPRQKL